MPKSQVKTSLSGADSGCKAELVPAEKTQRIQAERERLEMELTGPLECSHASYGYVAKIPVHNTCK